jgi:hypothetical protein
VRWSAAPLVRRAVDTAFAATVVGGAVLAPVGASARPADPPTVSVVRDGRRVATPSSTTATAATATAAPAPASPPPVLAAPPPSPAAVVVAPGDDLWTLAARVLATATGRRPDELADAEVARYWVQLCDANRARVSSGDLDLVYPGEVIVVPPVA